MTAQFLCPLDVRIVEDADGRPTYELLAPFGFFSRQFEREFWVPVGEQSRFDGPSIPQMLLWGTGASPGLRASCIHDWLIKSRTVERKVADRIFLEALRVCGVDDNLAQTMYLAVAAYTNHLEGTNESIVTGG